MDSHHKLHRWVLPMYLWCRLLPMCPCWYAQLHCPVLPATGLIYRSIWNRSDRCALRRNTIWRNKIHKSYYWQPWHQLRARILSWMTTDGEGEEGPVPIRIGSIRQMEMERNHQQWSWCSSPRNCKWAVRWRLVHPCRGGACIFRTPA
jgi:hypothetical protein